MSDTNIQIRVNLSKYATRVVNDDMHHFRQDKKDINVSNFYNKIFKNYYKHSKTLISEEIDFYTKELLKDNEIESNHPLILKLIKEKKLLLESKINLEKSSSKKIKVNKHNNEILENIKEKYNIDKSFYFKCVMESYAKLSYANREKYYYYDMFLKLETIIDRRIKIKIKTYLDFLPDEYIIDPYALMVNETSTHYYLVGVINRNPIQLFTIRISQIKPFDEEGLGKYILNKNTIEEVEYILDNNHLAYVTFETEDIVVCLDKKSRKKFHRTPYGRPDYSDDDIEKVIVDGETKYYKFHFNCSKNQILDYFFGFSDSFYIEKPEYLKNEFKNRYEKCLENYKKNHN